MLNLRLELRNPWSKDRFKNLGCLHGRVSTNKAWELEHTFYDGMLLDCEFKITTKEDHAGLHTMLGILGYAIHFSFYDTRHWDYENNTWMVYK
jgi:hypothetical protein